LICEKCKRWYPIVEEIPQMLPDELRNEKEDLKFLLKYENLVPKEVKEEGIPFNLLKTRHSK
jgi:predicted alternative tryptophan synthase beta-subunit